MTDVGNSSNANQMQMNNAIQNVTNVHVNVPTAAPTMVFVNSKSGPNFIVRTVWFLAVGWWLTALMIITAYALIYTIIGIPVAFFLINRIPDALTLRPRTKNMTATTVGNVTTVTMERPAQHPWYLRGAYFILVGTWLGAIWLVTAWLLCVSLIGLPLGVLMFDRSSTVITLEKH